MSMPRKPRPLVMVATIAVAGAIALVLAAATTGATRRRSPDRVRGAISAALAHATISATAASSYRSIYATALRHAHVLAGLRRHELDGVIGIVRGIAARGSLTGSRMPFVFLTLQRNDEWWSAHGPPAPGSSGEPETKG